MKDSMIQRFVEMINETPDFVDKKRIAARGFLEIYPFSLLHLYSYSILNETCTGVLTIDENGVGPLDLHGGVRDFTAVRTAFRTQQAVYSSGSEHIRNTPQQLIKMDMYRSSVLVVPICNQSTVIGYACPCYYYGTEPINEQLLESLTYYGKSIGAALVSLANVENKKNLSSREIEVLQRASNGESVKEMAEKMAISQFTIQDYMKSSIKKLKAMNRVQAVAEAIRQGIIK